MSIFQKNNVQLMPLYEGSDFNIYYPDFQFYIDRISNREYFSLIRYQLDAWQHLFKMVYTGLSNPKHPTKNELLRVAKEVTAQWQLGVRSGTRQYHLSADVVVSQYKLLISKKPDNLFFCVSDRTWWDGDLPPPNQPHIRWPVKLMKELLPETPAYATSWKIWAQNGQIHDFFIKFKNHNIIVVGPFYFSNFADKLGLPNCRHIEIHKVAATKHVNETKIKVEQAYKEMSRNGEDVIILFCAGAAGAHVIDRLHGKLPRAFMLELGRSLNVYYHYDTVKKKTPKWMWGGWQNNNPPLWILEHPEMIRNDDSK